MRERPILFSAPMVRALLAGTKTQTRRIVKPQPFTAGNRLIGHEKLCGYFGEDVFAPCMANLVPSPYGAPGDRLWVREAFSSERQEQAGTGAVRWVVIESGGFASRTGALYRATYDQVAARARRWRPGIHMPRCLSRITLEVTGVRVERLQDISADDVIAEGIDPAPHRCGCDVCSMQSALCTATQSSLVLAYADLWREINGADSWIANPWVWVIEFRRIEADVAHTVEEQLV